MHLPGILAVFFIHRKRRSDSGVVLPGWLSGGSVLLEFVSDEFIGNDGVAALSFVIAVAESGFGIRF